MKPEQFPLLNAMATLTEQRKQAADEFFEEADIPEVEDCNSWNVDDNFWSRAVFWKNEDGGDSVFGSFGVQFAPNSAVILDHWHNI